MSSGKSFNYQTQYFSREFDVFAPDLKGFGENLGMEKPYSLDDYILEVEEFKYKHGLVCPHIVAHSFGARIAIKATAKDKNFCNKLVLTGAAGLKSKPTFKKAVNKTTFNILKTFVKRERLKAFYSKDYLSLSPTMKESFKLIINEYLDDYLDKIENKTLIIFGKNDKETPLYMAKRLNNGIKDSKLSIFKDAGHFCFVDKPYKFNVEVREFLLSKD